MDDVCVYHIYMCVCVCAQLKVRLKKFRDEKSTELSSFRERLITDAKGDALAHASAPLPHKAKRRRMPRVPSSETVNGKSKLTRRTKEVIKPAVIKPASEAQKTVCTVATVWTVTRVCVLYVLLGLYGL